MESPTQSGALVDAVVDGGVGAAGLVADTMGVAGLAEVPEEVAGAACGDPHAVNQQLARTASSPIIFVIDGS